MHQPADPANVRIGRRERGGPDDVVGREAAGGAQAHRHHLPVGGPAGAAHRRGERGPSPRIPGRHGGGGQAPRRRTARPGRPCRTSRALPVPTLRWSAATGRHRPRAGPSTVGVAVRRGDGWTRPHHDWLRRRAPQGTSGRPESLDRLHHPRDGYRADDRRLGRPARPRQHRRVRADRRPAHRSPVGTRSGVATAPCRCRTICGTTNLERRLRRRRRACGLDREGVAGPGRSAGGTGRIDSGGGWRQRRRCDARRCRRVGRRRPRRAHALRTLRRDPRRSSSPTRTLEGVA